MRAKTAVKTSNNMSTETIHPNEIKVLERDRKDYGDLEELLDSINKYGIIEPIVVNQNSELIAGGRRLAAAKLGKWETVPIYRKETISTIHLQLMEMEENVRRKNYNWREEVHAIVRLHYGHKMLANAEGKPWRPEMTAEIVGYTPAYVSYCRDLDAEIDKPV